MVSKTVILGLLSKKEDVIDKALDSLVKEHRNNILKKIYEQQDNLDFSECNYYVISEEDYQTIEEVFDKYSKFQRFQKGKRRIIISTNEIHELKNMGLSNRQISEKFNVSEGTIRNRLKHKNCNCMISFKSDNLRK